MISAYKYIYGPVPSWRLGSSLGIDLLSQEDKVCNFDCIYCQLGKTKRHITERRIYVAVKDVVEEIERMPAADIDYITFSGRGEPALAENLGQAIRAVKLIRKTPVAILTNAALLYKPQVRQEASGADFVIAKLDAYSPESLQAINNPAKGIAFDDLVKGIKEFKRQYKGKLALQIMCMANNKDAIEQLAHLVNCIKPQEVQVNTPLRPCGIAPLKKEEILKIKDTFAVACKEIRIVSIYDERELRGVAPLSDKDTLKRRGKIML
ncbi:MAG: radical SAM protein [Candidatus Omnitrophica bacterium]|nr:radical SAM protein [Candidatus Omnitrophota bacterium]